MQSLGEFYTPCWLAEIILDESGYDGARGRRLLDPSCGPGVFLTLAIARARRNGATAPGILADIHGFELNPESARTARTNYLAAMGDLAEGITTDQIPVFCRDALLDPQQVEPFDYVVGNPPWVRWDHMPLDYRQATLPLWKSYGLFSLVGFQTRLGAGKDLSMLFTYAAADRYLKSGGTLAFVITEEVFKSKGAGEGFRGFRLGANGLPLQVRSVHDFVRLRPFENAGNKTAAILLTKGSETVYPVPYFVWQRGPEGGLERTRLAARPLGGPRGPWQTLPEDGDQLAGLAGTSAYRAVLGANANPYGVFWTEVQQVLANGPVMVRNLPELGKKRISAVTVRVESGCLFPALRGADLHRWSAAPKIHVLIVQDPSTRAAYPEAVMRERWPLTLEYLEQFREELLGRALYRKYHLESRHPFYSQFNVGPGLLATFKVVWRRMASDLSAAVISNWDGPLGPKPLVPLETTAFIGVETPEEAHYLCAILNSVPVRAFVKSFSSAGRGFGTPYVISQVRIPKFDASNAVHLELAEVSRRCHAGVCENEEELGRLVLSL